MKNKYSKTCSKWNRKGPEYISDIGQVFALYKNAKKN
jgi:hypothetical protein